MIRPTLTILLSGLLAALCGCDDPQSLRARYTLTVPASWRALPSHAAPLVPGSVLEAYEVPTAAGSGTLVVFRSPHAPETDASQLLTQTRYLLLNLPSLTLRGTRVVKVGQREAALVEATAQGDGRSFAPTGTGKPVATGTAPLVLTHRYWLRVPGDSELGTLEVQFHVPASALEAVRGDWEKTQASFRVDDKA